MKAILEPMNSRPCPICRKPTTWEGNPWKPFCSERCKTRDLGAWSSESYRVPVKPGDDQGEAWSGEEEEES